MPYELSGALTISGLVSAAMGDNAAAERYHEEALELARSVNDREAVARSLNNLGLIASARGDHQRGRILLEEAVGEHRVAGTRVSTAGILDSLARINLLLGDNNAARSRYVEALEAAMRFGDTLYLAECLEGIALLALAEGDAGRTLTLMGSASVIRKGIAATAMPDWRGHVDQGFAAARAQLGPLRADAAWERGGAMSVQEAIAYASGVAPAPARVDGNPLTGREAQVAALIAEGRTNVEIAQLLHIAARTADAHVEHIRNKLGLRSRSQIAVWAHERLGKT
jgi:non-specific serine/threonine protein kinase